MRVESVSKYRANRSNANSSEQDLTESSQGVASAEPINSTSNPSSSPTHDLPEQTTKMSLPNGTECVVDDTTVHPTMPLSTSAETGVKLQTTEPRVVQEWTREVQQEARSEPRPEVPPELADLTYKPLSDEFFKTIFYFSGMGTVIGSALSEGVHVEERHRGRAVDSDQIPARIREQLHKEEFPLVISCRDQAHNIYDGLRNLHNLLDNVPTYTDSNTPVTYHRTIGSVEVTPDDPIHGHKYFAVNRRM